RTADMPRLLQALHRLDSELGRIPADVSRALESAESARQNLSNGKQRSDPGSLAANELDHRLTRLEAAICRLQRQQALRAAALKRRDRQVTARSLVADAV